MISNFCSSKVYKKLSAIYPEGIASHSPGLPRFAATLGYEGREQTTLKGLRQLKNSNDATLSGYINRLDSKPSVDRYAINPGLCDATPSE